LRTRRPRFADGKKTNVNAYFRTGSFDLVNPSVLWEQKIGGKDGTSSVSTSVNVEYIYASGKYKYRHTRYNTDNTIANDTSAIRHNGDVHSLRIEGGLNGYLEQGKWHAKAYFYDSEKGLPGAMVNNILMNPQRQWDRNFFVQSSFQKRLFKNYDFLVNAKYSRDYMRYLNKDTVVWDETGQPAFKTMFEDNNFSQQEIYLSTANKYAVFPNWDINLSVDYIWNTLDANLANFVYPTRNTVLAALATALEWRRFKAQASLLGTFVFDNTKYGYAPSDKREYTPAVFLSYKPFSHRDLNLRAFYKRIFRMPTFNDLYYTDIGSIALRPEYTAQYNIGFQYEYNSKGLNPLAFTFRADAYYNEIIDKIVATPKRGSANGGLYRWQMVNLGYVEIRGVDVSAKLSKFWKLGKSIDFSLNYTFQKAQNFTPPSPVDAEFYGGQINYIPWHSGSAIVYAQCNAWDLNYSFIYVGERYHNSANIRANHSPPWYTHDVTIGKTFDVRNSIFLKNGISKMKLSLEINNILNQAYEVIIYYPMPGRNFKIILKIDI
jgi:outer membrane cobalamin receptor